MAAAALLVWLQHATWPDRHHMHWAATMYADPGGVCECVWCGVVWCLSCCCVWPDSLWPGPACGWWHRCEELRCS
jgi:hypothetical protein